MCETRWKNSAKASSELWNGHELWNGLRPFHFHDRGAPPCMMNIAGRSGRPAVGRMERSGDCPITGFLVLALPGCVPSVAEL